MSNDNTPTVFDASSAFGYDEEKAIRSMSDMLLTIDQDKGEWKYGGSAVGKEISLCWVAKRFFRTLFAKEYDDLKEGEPNEIVCRSADGYTAHGLGRRPKSGEDWRSKCAPQVCQEADTGRKVCKLAGGKTKHDWLCRPQLHALVMISWADTDTWLPAFLHARGVSFRDADDAFRNVFRLMKATAKRSEDGKLVPARMLWSWAYQARIEPIPRKKGHLIRWGRPDDLLEADLNWIDAWCRTEGAELWTRDKEQAEEGMRNVALTKEQMEELRERQDDLA